MLAGVFGIRYVVNCIERGSRAYRGDFPADIGKACPVEISEFFASADCNLWVEGRFL